MKLRLLILLVISVVQLSNAADDSLLAVLKGEWASRQWVSILKESSSPRDAMNKARNNKIVIFEKEGDHYSAGIMYNGGHEGDKREFSTIVKKTPAEYALLDCHAYTDEDGNNVIDSSLIGNIVFSANRNMAYFNIGMSMFSVNDTMIKIHPSLTSFINNNTICGNYQDDLGRRYKFYPDGNFDWAGVNCKYWVLLDYVLERNDVVYVENAEKTNKVPWIFQRNEDDLYLYQVKKSEENEGYDKDGSPLKLRRISKKQNSKQ